MKEEKSEIETILHLGWDTMSSTSSGQFCRMAAASVNVTPSKLVLLREMRRPPGKNIYQNLCYRLLPAAHLSLNNVLLYVVVPGFIRPSLSAGPSDTTEAMKIPRSSLPVLSSPTITKPET